MIWQQAADALVNVVRGCRRYRRRCFEAAGSVKYSRPASHQIDRKLERYLDYRGGFFVEAGANDGYLQSNTYYLEAIKAWRGILIEPVPELYRRCLSERRRSAVVNAALVAEDFPGREVTLHYFNSMTYAEGAFTSAEAELAHRAAAESTQLRRRTYTVSVPARTLTGILDELAPNRTIDFLSLDVEGFEVQALRGLNFEKHCPAYLLVEGNDLKGVRGCLSLRYAEVEQLSERDYLFKALAVKERA